MKSSNQIEKTKQKPLPHHWVNKNIHLPTSCRSDFSIASSNCLLTAFCNWRSRSGSYWRSVMGPARMYTFSMATSTSAENRFVHGMSSFKCPANRPFHANNWVLAQLFCHHKRLPEKVSQCKWLRSWGWVKGVGAGGGGGWKKGGIWWNCGEKPFY